MKKIFLLLSVLLLVSCNQNSRNAEGAWIKGSDEEKLKMIESQFGGFDQVMIELVYRYQELYWAGQDENWEYVDYQLEEMQSALEKGMIRRPNRAESTNQFIERALPPIKMASQQQDIELFNKTFENLRIECRTCHITEGKPFIQPITPQQRASPMKFKN